LHQALLPLPIGITVQVEIPINSHITIRNWNTKSYLHSHVHKYPLKYHDARVSSQGQQVNGYAYSDNNSFWQIELPPEYNKDSPVEPEKTRFLQNGDFIRLRHVATNSYLLTHDVASPMTPTHMEITTVAGDVAVTRFNETVWEVSTNDVGSKGKILSASMSVKLVNYVHHVGLNIIPKNVLPDWGFKMHEVNGNKDPNESGTSWTISNVTDPKTGKCKDGGFFSLSLANPQSADDHVAM
jgi:dolichyl-phosphate-mannose-protein mannosyltransferase